MVTSHLRPLVGLHWAVLLRWQLQHKGPVSLHFRGAKRRDRMGAAAQRALQTFKHSRRTLYVCSPLCAFPCMYSTASQGLKPCEAADLAPTLFSWVPGTNGTRWDEILFLPSSAPHLPANTSAYTGSRSAALLAGRWVAHLPCNHPDAPLSSYARTDPQDLGFGFTASLDTDLSHDASTFLTVSGLRKHRGPK